MIQCTKEINKIILNKDLEPEVTVTFKIKRYEDLRKFNEALNDFDLDMNGQRKIPK